MWSRLGTVHISLLTIVGHFFCRSEWVQFTLFVIIAVIAFATFWHGWMHRPDFSFSRQGPQVTCFPCNNKTETLIGQNNMEFILLCCLSQSWNVTRSPTAIEIVPLCILTFILQATSEIGTQSGSDLKSRKVMNWFWTMEWSHSSQGTLSTRFPVDDDPKFEINTENTHTFLLCSAINVLQFCLPSSCLWPRRMLTLFHSPIHRVYFAMKVPYV